MSEIENLINDQAKQISALTLEVQELKAHVEDFERIAHVWKRSYLDMEMGLKRKLANAEITIGQLEEELVELRKLARENRENY